MNTEQLPIEDLKYFSIINPENQWNVKLSEKDINNFLNGGRIVAQQVDTRIIFELAANNSKLNIQLLKTDRNLDAMLERSKAEPQYYGFENLLNTKDSENFSKKALIFDEKTKEAVEYDMIKDSKEITTIILTKDDVAQNRYKEELEKMKSFLLDKLDEYPEIGKKIIENINIVSNEIESVNSVNEKMNINSQKQNVELDVNDYDTYEDVERIRKENYDGEIEEEQERKSGFKR